MTTAENLNILVCTANIGNAEPTATSMSAWVPPNGSCEHVSPLGDSTKNPKKEETTVANFDIITIGMQEATWKGGKSTTTTAEDEDDDDLDEKLLSSSQTNNEQSSSTLSSLSLSSSKLAEFKLEALESQDSITLRTMLQQILGPDYSLLVQKQRGQMRLYIFVRQPLVQLCTNVKVKCENTGIGHVLANKGGIVASLTYRDTTRLSFCSAHLAAHEGDSYYAARCDNVREILRGTKLMEPYDAALSSHCLFVCGDLNFRTKFDIDEDNNAGTRSCLEHQEKVDKALDLVAKNDWETLYSYDELQHGIRNGDLLQGFQTLPCNFSPTFKVQREDGFVYKQQRTPSYTDRVLWKPSAGLEASVTPWAYEACPDFITSDHKPVRAAFFVTPNDCLPTKTIDKVHLIFQNLQCTDLPVMDVDGSSDPYLRFVLSPDLRTHKQSRRSGSKAPSWNKTKFVAKNLNPVWEEEVDVVIEGDVGADAMLLVTAMDYDMGSKDDIMGTLQLSVQDLISKVPNTRTFDEPLFKYGKESGRIKFTLDVASFDGSREQGNQKGGGGGVLSKAKALLGIKKQQKSPRKAKGTLGRKDLQK